MTLSGDPEKRKLQRENMRKAAVIRSERNGGNPLQVKAMNAACRGKASWNKNLMGPDNPLWQKTAVECANCGKIMFRKPSEIKKCRKFFCNYSCAGKWRSKNLRGVNNSNYGKGDKIRGKNHPNYKGGPVAVHCAQCGGIIYRAPCELLKKKKFFCNQKCQGRWKSKNQHPWSLNLTKETDARLKRTSERMIGDGNPMRNPVYRRRATKALLAAVCIKPNKRELELLHFFQHNGFPYKFVGDGSVIIDGKNPDYIGLHNRKKLIEFYGDYFHSSEKETNGGDGGKSRRNHFARLGYETLIIWEHELKDRNALTKKVRHFSQADKSIKV